MSAASEPVAIDSTVPPSCEASGASPKVAARETCGAALRAGYRHIDEARGYGHEADVARAIADEDGVAREDCFLVTKLSAGE